MVVEVLCGLDLLFDEAKLVTDLKLADAFTSSDALAVAVEGVELPDL